MRLLPTRSQMLIKNYEWMADAAETLSKAYEGTDYKKSLFYYKAESKCKAIH